RRHTRFSRDWSSDVCSSDLSLLLLNFPWAHGASSTPTLEQLVAHAQQQKLAQTSQWHALLHYRPRVIGFGSVSQADDPTFFLARSEERRVGNAGRSRWTMCV